MDILGPRQDALHQEERQGQDTPLGGFTGLRYKIQIKSQRIFKHKCIRRGIHRHKWTGQLSRGTEN